GDRTELPLDLAPYESRVLVFSSSAAAEPAPRQPAPAKEIDLSSDWKVTFGRLNLTMDYPKLHSWTDDEHTRFYSGEATYRKTIDVLQGFLADASGVALDFGPGTPIEPAADQLLGMRALFESPVHESAVVYVNGFRAGVVWHPPYSVDVSKSLKEGRNELAVVVGNTAMNEMAGRALPDYRLLNLRYGERFTPQDVKDIRPLPSGITGTVKLRRR
ncbi:MAG: glycoside hydrolase family 2 sugar binding protein, partial [Bryobacterales bacterium]|nr:glycoside hydrolase family 2 sugar binding protein [Bryobacterales bacterium]